MAGGDNAGEGLAKRTRRLLAEMDLRPKRSRGQSFLIDPSVAGRIADAVCQGNAPRVLEIGAGLGALTDPLAERAREVVAVEIQPEFVGALQRIFSGNRQVRAVEADALNTDLPSLMDGPPGKWRAAGNLPYSTASAIVLRLLEVRPPFERIVVMVQREVGERLLASPGDSQYGSLSVVTAYYVASSRVVARVSRGAFHPQPKVDSVVLALQPRRAEWENVIDEAMLFAVIRAGFGQRRKQLVNALSAAQCLAHIDRATAVEALDAAGIAPKARAEEVALKGFIALANALAESGVSAVVSR